MLSREMKDSGIEWIGEMPKKWNKIKLSKLIKISSGKPVERQLVFSDLNPYPVYGGGKLLGYANSFNCTFENILIGRVGSAGKVTSLKGNAWATDNALIITQTNQILNLDFLVYTLIALDLERIVASNAQPIITASKISNQIVPMPNTKIQNKIVDLLKKDILYIDNLLNNTQKSIEELKKYKQSLITEVVTKGLDKNVEMKDSGIEWIGEIPKDWEVNKLKRLFEIRKRIVGNNDYQVLSVTQKGLKIKDTSVNAGQMSSDYSKYQLVEPADFVMNHMDLLTGWIDNSVYTGVTSPDYRVFSTINNSKSYNEYFLYTFQMLYKNKIFYGMGQGVSNLGRWRLQSTTFLNLYLPVPSIEEQKQIVKYLNRKMNNIDALIELKHNIIDEYESYKKSLIYEYVTGKKEVGEEEK